MIRTRIQPLIIGLLLLIFPPGARGGEKTAPVKPAEANPRAILQDRDQMIREIIAQNDTAEAEIKKQLRELINGIIDFPELARRSLGSHWRRVSPAERREFIRLFRELIELTSTKKLEIFKADRIDYPEETIRGEKAEVKTLVYKGRERVEVIYLLHRVKGEWKLYDMIIDELGLTENYRTQFNKIIREKNFAGLLKRLRERIREEKAKSNTSTG